MNKHLTNNKKNLLRGITGLTVAGLAGGFMSAGSVSAAELCFEQGPKGLPVIVDCPPEFVLPSLPTFGAPEIGFGDSVDDNTLTEFLENRNSSDDSTGDGVQIPSADDLVDPDRFAPLEPNLDVFEQDNPFLGVDDDAEPELAQPEGQPEAQPEVQPEIEVQPEVQPEIEVQPEAQPETDSTDVGVTEVAPEETTDTETPDTETAEAVTPEAVAPQVTTRVLAPTVNIPDTDTNVDADADREIIEAAPVEVLTTDDTTTGGANLGLYAGLLLILGGGGSLAAIAASRRNRD
jgi:outer membrane biosynthesis protein TonB